MKINGSPAHDHLSVIIPEHTLPKRRGPRKWPHMRGKSHDCHMLSNALKPGIWVSGRVRPGPVGKFLPPVAGTFLRVILPPVAGVARFIRTDALPLATARAVLVCLGCLMAAAITWLRLRNIVNAVKGLLEDLGKRRLRFCGCAYYNIYIYD